MRFLADENFNGHVLHALLQNLPKESVIRVQDVGLMEADDPVILEWAATHDCILLTHDIRTIPEFVNDRVSLSLRTPGVFEISKRHPIRVIVFDLILILECYIEGEWADRITFIPL